MAITHLEPDILSMKSSGPYETLIQIKLVEVIELQQLFQIQTDDAVKVLHSVCQQIWKAQQWTELSEN